MDPVISLAFSIQSTPGLYALLLGSGLSRGAGVLTGWDIVEDLIRKIAALEGVESCVDPVAWYRERFKIEPDYSTLLERLSSSNAERAQILRAYFEPTDEERERGVKSPGESHRAVAQLVAGGYVKVIITTNFDRLLEQALEAAGVTPTIISSADAINGMLPLPHVRCLVLKLHGDYHDTRIRNTPIELDRYDPAQDQLLDRIFDEYGLVVCGWSGDWDTALRSAIERAKNRRFSMYWASRGALGERAERLVNQRQGHVIKIRDADSFLRSVADKVQALSDSNAAHPATVKAAVAELKRYLPEHRFRIRLGDLITGEVERTVHDLKSIGFTTSIGTFGEEFERRLKKAISATETLRTLVAHGCFWGTTDQSENWVSALERLANAGITLGINEDLGQFPALAALYSAGISAIAANRIDTLAVLLSKPRIRIRDAYQPLVSGIIKLGIYWARQHPALPGYEGHHTPLNDFLFESLRSALGGTIADEHQYSDCFDKFEYLVSLVCRDGIATGEKDHFRVGRFGWSQNRLPGVTTIDDEIEAQVRSQGNNWPVIKVGLFNGDSSVFLRSMNELRKHVASLNWR